VRLDDIPLFSTLKSRMGWLNARQKLVAENVANSDTPGYVPRDLKAQSFDRALRAAGQAPAGGLAPVRVVTSRPGHMAPEGARVATSFGAEKRADSETTLDGNAVVLEEQMLKMAESRMAYDAAISLYQKSLAMIRIAAKPPGMR
jgi:flagellar basal-body rod protein FlgB